LVDVSVHIIHFSKLQRNCKCTNQEKNHNAIVVLTVVLLELMRNSTLYTLFNRKASSWPSSIWNCLSWRHLNSIILHLNDSTTTWTASKTSCF
jgi:hypothetical protein